MFKPDVEAYQRLQQILEEGPFVPGTRAVHRAHFLYTLRWSQAGARITEMNALGWAITSINLPEHEWQSGIRTAYRLDSKPLKPEPQEPPKSKYMQRVQQEKAAACPLFANGGQP